MGENQVYRTFSDPELEWRNEYSWSEIIDAIKSMTKEEREPVLRALQAVKAKNNANQTP